MAVRTNTANGGTTYIDMDIQVVSADASQYTLRAVIYLTSLNVIDSTNSCDVTGQWSRGGALALNGVYNASPIWFQDVSFPRTAVDQVVGWNLSFSGINYWGVTLSGTAYYTVPAALQPPGTPFGYSARTITLTSAYTTGVSSTGSGHNNLWVRWGTTTGYELGNRQMGAWTDGYMDNCPPGTLIHFSVAAANAAGWSGWGGDATFTTLNQVPGTPAAPTVSDITQTTATVSWTPPSNSGSPITSYGVEVATDAAFSNVVRYQSSGAITGLTPGTPYWSRVRAGNAAGPGAYSTPTAFSTLAGGGLSLNVDGVNKDAELWMNVMGTWKLIELHTNVLDVWKRIT